MHLPLPQTFDMATGRTQAHACRGYWTSRISGAVSPLASRPGNIFRPAGCREVQALRMRFPTEIRRPSMTACQRLFRGKRSLVQRMEGTFPPSHLPRLLPPSTEAFLLAFFLNRFEVSVSNFLRLSAWVKSMRGPKKKVFVEVVF
jgi:hypothetical protein